MRDQVRERQARIHIAYCRGAVGADAHEVLDGAHRVPVYGAPPRQSATRSNHSLLRPSTVGGGERTLAA
jgi:hypothetical protein